MKNSELQEAGFKQELCANAAFLMRTAMKNREAYVINGALVLKLMRVQEAFELKGEVPQTFDKDYYGVRVGLCIKDSPPLKRGEWYTTSERDTRMQIIDAAQGESPAITLPIVDEHWRIVRRIASENKSQELLDEATAYAASMSETRK